MSKVVVQQMVSYTTFKVPDGVDLEDTDVVKEWYVQGGCLYIVYVDGREEEIEFNYDSCEDPDPGKVEIDDAKNWYDPTSA